MQGSVWSFAIDLAPVDLAPVDLAPVDLAPVDLAPVDLAPVDLAPVDLAPVDLAPVDLAPIDLAPIDLAPIDLAPVDLAPIDLAPVDLAPVDLAPLDLAPIDLAPIDLAPIDLGPIDLAPIDLARAHDLLCQRSRCKGTTGGSSLPTLEVQGDNWRCEDVYPLYGLTRDEFAAQNNGVDCCAALTRGQTLNVTKRKGLTPCSVFYFIQPGDTCESVAASLPISSMSLENLNPGFDCSSPLPPSRSLCIEREDGADDGSGEFCNTEYSVSGTSSCAQAVKDYGFYSMIELYRLNPGLVCYTSQTASLGVSWRPIWG
ncbi:unnamed protein product [Closterium sp. Naga37s-1]|nr:unnamed protein product [Closterium sp. Naga37s-1]